MGPFYAFKNLNENLSKKELTNEFKEIFKNKVIMYLFEDVAKSVRESEYSKSSKENEKIVFSKIIKTFYQICNKNL